LTITFTITLRILRTTSMCNELRLWRFGFLLYHW